MSADRFKNKVAAARFLRLQEVLRRQPMTVYEITEAIGLTDPRQTRTYIAYARSQGQVHIAEYRERVRSAYRSQVEVYAWGPGEDAERPKRTDAERRQEYREREQDKAELRGIGESRAWMRDWQPKRDWAASWVPTRSAA